jgi:hypothetical protein
VSISPEGVDIGGLIDMHIHTAPDVSPRSLDDFEAARQAAEAGMRAIVLKSHITLTADRAALAQALVPEVRVFGGLALNNAIGGLNPTAVETALQLGARVIWMPTISALNHALAHGGSSGIRIAPPGGELQPPLLNILDLIGQQDAILATGHLAVPEIQALVSAAQAAGVRRILVTHPEVPWVAMPASIQEELRSQGVYFERCFVSTTPGGGGVPLARIVADIRRVGVGSTVLATDLGQIENPLPVEGLRAYVAALLAEGLSEEDIRLMAGANPAWLLGLD